MTWPWNTTVARMDCVPVDLWHGWSMSRAKGKVDNSDKPSVLRCSDASRMHVYILLMRILLIFLRVSRVFCFRACFQQIFLSIFVGVMICSMHFRNSDRKEGTYFNRDLLYWLGVDYDQQEFQPTTWSRLCQLHQNSLRKWRWVLW